MRNIRTDLALEAHIARGDTLQSDDITKTTEDFMGYTVTTLTVGEKSAKEIDKPAGIYISVGLGKLWNGDDETLEKAAEMISMLLLRVAPEKNGCVLVACLGNRRITPDSIGPKASSQIIVTRHIKHLNPTLYQKMGFNECASVATGVFGETGVESAAIIKGVADIVKPKVIIAIDALSARGLDHVSTTVQITSNGIAPGSGVANSRKEISEKTMGCPVISIGFPTVVEASTLTLDMLESSGVDREIIDAAEKKLYEEEKNLLFVAPKDCDIVTDCLGKLAAMSVNLFVHGISKM